GCGSYANRFYENRATPTAIQHLVITTTLALLLALSPATHIPKNFLLTERAARQPLSAMEAAELAYKISDHLTKPLEVNPCLHKHAIDRGRVAARTITYWSSAPSSSSEQLILYKTPGAARSAFTALLAEARRCATKRIPTAPELRIQWRTSK